MPAARLTTGLGLQRLEGLGSRAFRHALLEGPFNEFMQSLRNAYRTGQEKPILFICAFALFQGEASDVAQALGQTIVDAPFVQALRSAETSLIVRNSKEDLYTRAWCLVELIFAKKFGFYGTKRVLITGPNDYSNG